MQKRLNGMHETVKFLKDTHICLYNNSSDEMYPVHWHSPFEMIMPSAGEYVVTCDKNTFCLRTGDIIIICPGTLHSMYAPVSGERIIFQISLSDISLTDIDTICSYIQPCTVITPEEYPEVYHIIRETVQEISSIYMEQPPFLELGVYSLFMKILYYAGIRSNEKNANGDKSPIVFKNQAELIHNSCIYINRHYREPLSLENVSAQAGFSKYHFERLFKAYTGMSFYRYLTARRISAAKHILSLHTVSIQETAYECGFSNAAAFSRMFRKYAGYTPTEFICLHEHASPYDACNGYEQVAPE